MQVRLLAATLCLPTLVLTGCDSNESTGLGITENSTASVQFINASTTTLDVAANGAVATGNGALGFGTASACVTANAANSGLAVRETGTSTPLSGFTPAFQVGGSYTVIAYPGVGGTTLQFATVSNAYTPAAGQAGLRVFNAAGAGSNLDVYVTTPGAALGTPAANNVGSATGSSYFNVSAAGPQQIRVTNAGSQTVLLDVGNTTFTAGRNATLVISPALPGTLVLRAFVVPGCPS